MLKKLILLTGIFVLFARTEGWAATATWIGAANGSWSVGTNCSGTGGSPPGSTDDVVFDSTSNTTSTVDAGFSGTIASLSINSGYTSLITLGRLEMGT